jgi:molybdopterin/thiamine biosynthesis adenylyltransferase
MPIRQSYYYSVVEVIPEVNTPIDSRMRGLQICIGSDAYAKLRAAKIFMVGCGAIGCELLKNYAMIDLGAEGAITVTDPDIIEVSNLSR